MKYVSQEQYQELPIERYKRYLVGNHVCLVCFQRPCICGHNLYASEQDFPQKWQQAERIRTT